MTANTVFQIQKMKFYATSIDYILLIIIFPGSKILYKFIEASGSDKQRRWSYGESGEIGLIAF